VRSPPGASSSPAVQRSKTDIRNGETLAKTAKIAKFGNLKIPEFFLAVLAILAREFPVSYFFFSCSLAPARIPGSA
jgi:hypothetical protein